MARILADIPDADLRWLDAQAAEQGKSRAALLREAVSLLREGVSRRGVDAYCGMWRDRADVGEGQGYVRQIREGGA